MTQSLRVRLALGALVAIGLVLLTVWFSLSRLFTDYVVDRYTAEMSMIADTLAAQLSVRNGAISLAREPSDPRFFLPAGGLYWQVSPQQGEPLRSRSLWDTIIRHEAKPALRYKGFAQSEGPDGTPLLVFSRSLTLGEGASPLHFNVYAAFPRQELDAALDAYHSELQFMLLATATLLVAAAFLQGAIGLRPLARLRERVALLRAGQDLDLGLGGPSEIRPLVNELNLLLAERATAVERARARASDLAHALKTPLTVLSQMADGLPEHEREQALQQVELIRQRADRQLQAARMGVEQMATTLLASLVGKLVAVLRPITSERGVVWTVDIDPSMTLDADPADLAEALGNVLDNAAKWARSRIEVSAFEQDGRLHLQVGDDGTGVEPADHDRILRRGGRLQEEPEGFGLGLAISADIMEAYRGDLRLEQSRFGGLQVVLVFPENVGRSGRARKPG